MNIIVSKFAFYKPSPENPLEQPKLEFVDPLFRRRLSQLTRMTIQVVHDLGSEASDCKLIFTSFRGEIARQLKINKGLVEDADVMPASFSISVFNTPPAAATIALKNKAGYTAIYPSEDNFASAVTAAAAEILSGTEQKIVFVYADETVPEEYSSIRDYTAEPALAFACILERGDSTGKELDLSAPYCKSPAAFLENFVE